MDGGKLDRGCWRVVVWSCGDGGESGEGAGGDRLKPAGDNGLRIPEGTEGY